MALGMVLSFSHIDPTNSMRWGALDGYRYLLSHSAVESFFRILTRSLIVTVATILVSIPISYYIISLKKGKQKALLALIAIPWLVNDMLRAFGWQALLAPNGVLYWICNLFFDCGPMYNLRYNFQAVILGLSSSLLPVGILTIYAAFPSSDKTEWLAVNEYSGPFHAFKMMAIKRVSRGIMLSCLIVFIMCCFSSAETKFLDGPTQTSIQTITASLVNIGVPVLLSFSTFLVFFMIFLFVIAYLVFAIIFKAKKRNCTTNSLNELYELDYQNRSLALCETYVSRALNLFVKVFPAVLSVGALTICWAPIVMVCAEAFIVNTPMGAKWTLANFHLFYSSNTMNEAFFNSAVVACLASILSVWIAFCLSLSYWNKKYFNVVGSVLIILMFLSGDAYALCFLQSLKLFCQPEGNPIFIILAHTAWILPFVTGTLMLGNFQINPHILESAFEYSKGPLLVIFRYIFRLNFGRLIGALFLAATMSLNEYVRSSYLGGSFLTLSNEVHGRLTTGFMAQNREIFVIELIAVLFSIFSVLLIVKVNKKN